MKPGKNIDNTVNHLWGLQKGLKIKKSPNTEKTQLKILETVKSAALD